MSEDAAALEAAAADDDASRPASPPVARPLTPVRVFFAYEAKPHPFIFAGKFLLHLFSQGEFPVISFTSVKEILLPPRIFRVNATMITI